MVEVKNSSYDDVLEVEFIETFTQSDFEHLLPVIEKHIAENDNPLLIISMQEFNGWDKASTFWKDMKMDASYISSFERIAAVGDKKWEEWMTKLISPLAPQKLHYFKRTEMDKARSWLKAAG